MPDSKITIAAAPKDTSWKCYEVQGIEIHAHPEGTEPLTVEQIKALPTLGKEALCVGQRIIVANLFGWGSATVVSDGYGGFYAENTANIYPLEFSGDARACWVNSCAVNRRSIQHLAKLK